MQILGEWFFCDDGIRRPVIRGEVLAADGAWVQVPFLIDTGADRTVLNRLALAALALQPLPETELLGGLGGTIGTALLNTQIRVTDDAGGKVAFRSRFAAVNDLEALDMSVLGRDVTDLFAVIVDRPGDVVCLISQRHTYRIERR